MRTERSHTERSHEEIAQPMADQGSGTTVGPRTRNQPTTSGRHGDPGGGVAPATSPIDTARLEIPIERAGLVRRERLLARLAATSGSRVIAVIATAGAGKTTLVSQLARSLPGAVGWVTADETDNDAKQLLRGIVASLDDLGALDPSISPSLASPESTTLRILVRFTNSLRQADLSVTIVVDDVHVITSDHALDVIAMLVERLPAGSTVVLAGRTEPALPFARWRAAGSLAELDTRDLALDASEAERIVAAAGVRLRRAEIEAIVEATEGWAAGVYLATLSRRANRRLAEAPRLGEDAYISGYIDSELLADLDEEDLRFLARTSILDELTGPLCDAVAATAGSAARLEVLERRNMLIIPVDPERRWFRYHALLRDALHRRLERMEPAAIPDLHRAAAAWLEANGDVPRAVEHALRAEDVAGAARLIDRCYLQVYRTGGEEALDRWLTRIGDEAIASDERLPFVTAWLAVVRGDADRAERWTQVAEARAAAPPGAPGDGGLALLRAVQCRDGIARMRADADLALRLEAPDGQWRAAATSIAGIARVLDGETDDAQAMFREVETMASARGTIALHMALGERALHAIARRSWAEAEDLVRRHRTSTRATGVDEHPTSLLGLIAEARLSIRGSDIPRARELLARAQAVRPRLTAAMPYWSVRCLVELARTQLLTADNAGAAASVRQAEHILDARPDLGTLVAAVAELRQRLDVAADGAASAGSLTPAELRLLTLLQTHLTFKEMASRLGISPNTAKTESMSLYGKLDVTSRSEAVERAVELGLLESMLPPVTPLLTRTRRCPDGRRQV